MYSGLVKHGFKWHLVALHLAVLPAGAHVLAPTTQVTRVSAHQALDLGLGTSVPEAGSTLLHRTATPSGKVRAQVLHVLYSKPRPVVARSGGAPVDAAKPESAQPAARAFPSRARESVVTVGGTGPGQAGYVHFFLIRGPDEVPETQVGIELPDQRIAWSFPGLGVVVSPFIESGEVDASGKRYGVEHLYGIRPFASDKSMQALQAEIANRVAPWVDDETGYCELKPARGPLCVSCLGFVMRILFPGRTPEFPTLPPDFSRVIRDTTYTTEDLLIYLTGLHTLASSQARRKRIEELVIPVALRDDLLRLVDAANSNAAVAGARPRVPARLRSATGPAQRATPQRPRSTRKL